MANSLKKFIAVLSASAVVASVIPVAFAETKTEIDPDAIIYDESFDDFSGTLVNLAKGSNTDYSDTHGLNFACGTRSGSSDETGIFAKTLSGSDNYISLAQTRFNNAGRQPIVELIRTSTGTFENAVYSEMDLRFSDASVTLNIVDSSNSVVELSAPDASYAGKWLHYVIASTDEGTSVIAFDGDDVANFYVDSDALTNIAKLTTPDVAFTSIDINNLVVADMDYTIPDDVILVAAKKSLEIADGQMGMEVVDGVYHVKRDVVLPAAPDGASVEWELSQRAIDDESAAWESTSLASIYDGTLIPNATDDSVSYYVKATATVIVGELSDTKEFLFVIEPISDDEAAIRYDESFDSFSGTLVNLANGTNTSYRETHGLTFSCGTRDTSSNETGVFAGTVSGTDNYLYFCQTRYDGQGRVPVITFTRTNSVKFNNAVYIEMDLNFGDTNEFYAADSSGNAVELSAPGEAYVGEWLHYVIASSGSNTSVMVYDADGTPINYYVDSDALTNLARFTAADIIFANIGINNLVVADKRAAIPDEDIVAAAKANIDITSITSKDGVYTASRDFELPVAPVGTNVTWKAWQKAKDSTEWEESSFIAAAGTNATINPTSEIDNYDVKLVATITAGTAEDIKEFVIALPNPMDEITGFIASQIPVVNTTDKNTADKTITFNLSGEDVLKYDLVLPLKTNTYRNTTAAWTSSDSEHISIAADGTATIMTSDLNTHDVTLTVVVTYKKGNITYSSEAQTFTVKMGYTSEDVASDDATLSKYKVRFDKAYDANFTSIPSSATSNITLPAKGYFGSDFTWNSSVPTSITNQGVVKRASTTKSVVLAAAIISGTVSDEKTFTVSVPATASSSGGGGGGGGSVSSTGTVSKGGSTGVISTPNTSAVEGTGAVNGEEIVDRLLEEAAQSQDLFTDLSSARWASDAINGLAKAGVINGVTDTQFAPNATVTRAQFAKMLMGTFGLTASAYTTSSFADVATDAWYFDAVETAYNLGIINGVEDGVFAPDALITRQDMAVMVTRAAEAAGKTISEVTGSHSFGDAYRISDYAVDAVDTLVKAGIINGISDAEFAPLDNATRAQAAKILYNFL